MITINYIQLIVLEKKAKKILGKEFKQAPYELDRTFGGIEFTNKDLYVIGSGTLKKLLSLNIPFNVGRLGDNQFHVIFYFKLKGTIRRPL